MCFKGKTYKLAMVPLLVAVTLVVLSFRTVAEAKPIPSLMARMGESLGKASDEATRSAGKVVQHIGAQGDQAVERTLRGLANPKKPPMSTTAALASLEKAGIHDVTGDLRKALESFDGLGRRNLTELLQQSKRAVAVGVQSGLKADDVVKALQKGGPESVVAIRTMKDSESVVQCLKGFDKFGEPFTNFVKKGDEAAVKGLAEHWDELDKLPKAKIDDLLARPTKYFDELGKPTSEFRKMMDSIGTGGRGAAGRGWAKNGVILGLGMAIGAALDRGIDCLPVSESVRQWIRNIKWAFFWAVVLFLIWIFLPFWWPLLLLVLRAALKLLGSLRGRLGTLSERWLAHLPDPASAPVSPPILKRLRLEQLRIGLLGARRSGKSTFIVMLTKHLRHLVEGASLDPYAEEPDARTLSQIADEVSHCQPTREDKQIRLDLHWPFRWSGEPAKNGGGKLAKQLVLTDFPGEWAKPDALKQDRSKLAGYLQSVDGLFVVIDPTDLESEADMDRWKQQEEAIDSMFRSDGLNLGVRFKRAMGIIVTKRDAISPGLLKKLAQRNNISLNQDFENLCQLASKRSLTEEESVQLGRSLLELLFPGKMAALKVRLDGEERAGGRKRWYHRLLGLLKHRTTPQFSVFAVSQLGFDLGQQVVKHRDRVKAWEESAKADPRPEIRLDLDRVNKEEIDLHYPFKWMFNSIPAGWLHQANAHQALRSWIYRRWAYRRFKGAPVVQRDRCVFWTRVAAGILVLLLLGAGTKPVIDAIERRHDRQEVVGLFELAASGDCSEDQLHSKLADCRRLRTRPLISELNDFERLLDAKEKLARSRAVLDNSSQDVLLRIEAAQTWLRIYGGLPLDGTNWPEPLREFRRQLVSSLPDVSNGLVQVTKGRADDLMQGKQFDEAVACVAEIGHFLEGLCSTEPAVQTAGRELDGLHTAFRIRKFSFALQKLQSEIETLVTAAPPQFPVAISRVDNLVIEQDLVPECIQQRDDLRNKTVERFWKYTKTEAEDAVEDDKAARAAELLGTFLQTPAPNAFSQEAIAFREKLPDKRVANAIQKAKGLLQDGKTPEAWDRLDRVRLDIGKATPDTRREWYKTAKLVKCRQELFADAIELMLDPQLSDETWPQEERNQVWESWAGDLEKKSAGLLAQGKAAEARRQSSLFLNMAKGCPAPIYKRIEILVKEKIPAAVFEQVLDNAIKLADEVQKLDPGVSLPPKEREKLEQALDMLLGLRTDVAKVQNSRRLVEWGDRVVDIYQRLDRYPKAIDFLKGLAQEANTEIHPTSDKLEEIWSRYAVRVQQQFEEAIKKGDEPGAWLLLWKTCREPEASESFRKRMEQFSQEQINQAMKTLEGEIAGLCTKKNFKAAAAAVAKTKKGFDPWLSEEKSQVAERLKSFEQRIRQDELLFNVDTLCSKVGRSDPEKLHEKVLAVLNEPDLPDDLRGKAMVAKEDNLTYWERQAYEAICEVADNKNLPTLRDRVLAYTAKTCPFSGKQATERKRAVAELKTWLELFDHTRTYTLDAFNVRNFPKASWYELTNWHPAFRLRVVRTNGDSQNIDAKEDVAGDGDVTNFINHNSFKWKKGDELELAIWHGDIGEAEKCIGEVKISDVYALPRLGRAWHQVPYEDSDYKRYGEFKDFRVSISVRELKPVPTPPPYK